MRKDAPEWSPVETRIALQPTTARELYPELEINSHDVADAVAVGLHVVRIAA